MMVLNLTLCPFDTERGLSINHIIITFCFAYWVECSHHKYLDFPQIIFCKNNYQTADVVICESSFTPERVINQKTEAETAVIAGTHHVRIIFTHNLHKCSRWLLNEWKWLQLSQRERSVLQEIGTQPTANSLCFNKRLSGRSLTATEISQLHSRPGHVGGKHQL